MTFLVDYCKGNVCAETNLSNPLLLPVEVSFFDLSCSPTELPASQAHNSSLTMSKLLSRFNSERPVLF